MIAITDEIYEHIVYDGRPHVALAALDGMRERSVTIGGMSKTYAVTGWRVGTMIAPPHADPRLPPGPRLRLDRRRRPAPGGRRRRLPPAPRLLRPPRRRLPGPPRPALHGPARRRLRPRTAPGRLLRHGRHRRLRRRPTTSTSPATSSARSASPPSPAPASSATRTSAAATSASASARRTRPSTRPSSGCGSLRVDRLTPVPDVEPRCLGHRILPIARAVSRAGERRPDGRAGRTRGRRPVIRSGRGDRGDERCAAARRRRAVVCRDRPWAEIASASASRWCLAGRSTRRRAWPCSDESDDETPRRRPSAAVSLLDLEQLPLDTELTTLQIISVRDSAPPVGEVTHLERPDPRRQGRPGPQRRGRDLAGRQPRGLPPHRAQQPRQARRQLPGVRPVPHRVDRRVLLPDDQAGPLPRPDARTSTSRSSKGGKELLTTQCYVKGHPGNDRDGVTGASATPRPASSVTVDFAPLEGLEDRRAGRPVRRRPRASRPEA